MLAAAVLRYMERFLDDSAGFTTIWLLCVGLIWHIRMNRAGAFKGDAEAARKVILPAYEPVLFVMAIINGAYIIFLVVTLATGYFDVFISPVLLESFSSGNQFMFVTVLMLMFEKSLSFPAIKRAVGLSLVLSYYTTLYVWLVTKFGGPNHQKEFTLGLQFVRGLLMVPFAYAFIKPPNRATKRIIRELCFAAFVFYVLMRTLSIGEESDSEHVLCKIIFSGKMVWASVSPLRVYTYSLK
ncbi:hypothetical protein PC119_g16282 [Phytophthora cactorum]|nr:hypothetical protein PC111_g13778 [Phytophthora cactorum]KAG3002526.1 hypothetical protein PC119_g16282 [Phytophthora cactorum]